MARGKLITIEGIDGAGKSTLTAALCAEMQRRGARVQALREPGGVQLSERIRALLADPQLQIGAAAEALLYAAARAQLVATQLQPLLQAGTDVLLDRFLDSSLAYQGAGRELGVERVRAINQLACDGLAADRTLLLEISPALARERLRAREGAPDRLEGEQDVFFERVAAAYVDIAESEPERIRRIDATLAPGGVLEQAIAAIEDLLPSREP